MAWSEQHIGLLASEMCSFGGIQSFMLRIAEVITEMADNPNTRASCLSLNDTTASLEQSGKLSDRIKFAGAGRSKSTLALHCLRAGQFDVLVVGHIGLSPLASLLKKAKRVKTYIVILHGIEAWQKLSFMDRKALLGASRIVATTNYTAEECARLNDIALDRFSVIPICANRQQIAPSLNFKLNGLFKLLCVGRQETSERYKGYEDLFRAMTILKGSHPQVHLNLVGTGDNQVRLKETAHHLGVSDRVTFWNALSDRDLLAAYQDCDVFAMPSKKEGFGIVFLEAMSFSKPCIGGNHGGTPDVIHHGRNGYLVEFGDVGNLAKYIQELADNPSLRIAMGKQGLQAVQGRFSPEVFAQNYEALITTTKALSYRHKTRALALNNF